MANPVLPPTIPGNQEDDYNPASDLARAEATPTPLLGDDDKQRLRDVHETDQMEGANADPSRNVRNQENSGGNQFDYDPSGKRKGGDKGQGKNGKPSVGDIAKIAGAAENPLTALNAIRKGGPIGLIISIILGVAALMFGSFSLLPVHIYESFLSKYDNGTTSYSLRTDKVIADKLSSKATTATCNVTSILCRFTRPSNYMLKQMAANNITPLDSSGQPIEKNSIWPNKRPKQLVFTDSSGKSLTINASDVRTTLATNTEFRAAYHGALKTRLQIFSDSIFKSVATKFGFNKNDPTTSAQSESDVNAELDSEANESASDSTSSDGTTHVPTDTTDEAAAVAAIKDNLTTKAASVLKKIVTGGSVGGAIQLSAGLVCALGDVPGIISSTQRLYVMGQLVRFGGGLMRSINAIMNGTASLQEATAVSSDFTNVVDGQSAMDSYGMRSLLYGDTSPGNDSVYKKYVPGGAATAVIPPSIETVTSSAAKKDACAAALNPVTGLAIDAAIAGSTFGAGEVANFAAGQGISLAITVFGPFFVKHVIGLIPQQFIKDSLLGIFGDITKGAVGLAFGDLAVSSAANTFGQLDNGGANMPMTKDQAVQYRKQADATSLAYAQEDQATLSPFDASSNNTMMGTIVNALVPLYGSMGSLSSFMSSFSSIASTSFSGLLTGKTFAATDDTSQYSQCSDVTLDSSVAAGPFCNIIYGIPTQYLDMDPEAIATDLVNSGQIDPTTGEALPEAAPYQILSTIGSSLGIPAGNQITSYYNWLQTCTDGSAEIAQDCVINDQKTAEFALYTIDHRVQKNIDNEDSTDTSSAVASGTVTNSGTKQELAKEILDSGKATFLDNNGSSAAARKKIFQDIADGTTDGNSLKCGMNIKVLQLIVAIINKHTITIGDTNRLCDGTNNGFSQDRHTDGNGSAIDIVAIDGVALNGYNAKTISLINEIAPLLTRGTNKYNESELGQVQWRAMYGDSVNLPGINQVNDFATHLHVSFPLTDDPNLKTVPGGY